MRPCNALVLALLGGCGRAAEPGPPPPAPFFDACVAVVREGDRPSDTLAGTVTDAGFGEAPIPCGLVAGEGDRWWVRAADLHGGDWVAEVLLPDGPPPPAPGSRVTVGWRPSGYDDGVLELRDADDALVLWLGRVGDPEHLAPGPDGLGVERGELAGLEAGACGSSAYYDLVVDGVVLPYGDHLTIGDLELRHGGYRERAATCPDASGAEVALAAVPR